MKIALYDIDYTIIPFDSFYKFVLLLLKNKPANLAKLPCLIFFGILTLFKLMSLSDYKSKWLSLTEHLNDDELDALSKTFVETEVIPFIKKDVHETIEQYRKDDYLIVFATASFEFYLKYLALHFNADLFFGTEIEVKNGKRTIKGVNCKGLEKINRIKHSIGHAEVARHASIGFSDSMSDYPFTKLVGTFNIVHKKNWVIKKIYAQQI